MERPTFYESSAVAHWAERGERRAPTVSTAAAGPTARARSGTGSGPGGSDAPTEHGGARAGSAQLTYRDVSAGGGHSRHPPPSTASRSAREPACADTDIRKSARDHYLANKLFVLLSKNIRVRRRALATRSPSRHGVAHANRFPAAGRLMRAGRAGAGGGSDACAHRRPSLSTSVPPRRSERDDDNSLSQRRLVNTNRPRSRDKIFDLHFTTHTSACADRVATAPHTCALLANCSRPPPRRRRAAGVLHLTIFPENWHAPSPWTRRARLPRGRHSALPPTNDHRRRLCTRLTDNGTFQPNLIRIITFSNNQFYWNKDTIYYEKHI